MFKKTRHLLLAALMLSNFTAPAMADFMIKPLEIAKEAIDELSKVNTAKNHGKLHLGIFASNILVPLIINSLYALKKDGLKMDPKDSYKHLVDLRNLFKKEDAKQGETAKSFKQKWTEFAQTHKTSAWLIRAQLAALALSGVSGAWAKRYLAIIAKCYVKGDVFPALNGDKPKLYNLDAKHSNGKPLWFPQGFMYDNNDGNGPKETDLPSLIYFSLNRKYFCSHPAYRAQLQKT